MTRTVVLMAALGAVLGSSACRPSFEAIRKKHGQAIEARLTQVEKIGKLLELTPLVAADDPRIVIPPRPAEPVGIYGVIGMAQHVVLMYQEAFADLTQHGSTQHRVHGSNLLNVCASLIRKGACPGGCGGLECSCSFEMLDDLLAKCGRAQILLAVRTLEYGAPAAVQRTTPDLGPSQRIVAVAGLGDARVESFSFKGGLMRAEVHAFELLTGRRLGGFRVSTESNDTVRRTTVRNQPLSPYLARDAVETDFAERCRQAIVGGIREHVPGAF